MLLLFTLNFFVYNFDIILVTMPKAKKPSKQAEPAAKASSHRQELEDIAEKDPEFFKFLQQEDADLLDFNDSDVDIDEDAGEDGMRSRKSELFV